MSPTTQLALISAGYMLVCSCAYGFGYWLGWVTDPKQWPRHLVAMTVEIFRWDRQIKAVLKSADEVRFLVDWQILDRAPRETARTSTRQRAA